MTTGSDRQAGPEQPDGLAELLRTWRKRALLTQEGLATRAGVSVGTVRGVEAGRIRRPHGATLLLLADGLGLTADERVALTTTAWGERPSQDPSDSAVGNPQPRQPSSQILLEPRTARTTGHTTTQAPFKQRRRALSSVISGLAACLITLLVSSAPPQPMRQPSSPVPQRFSGPTWTLPPTSVPSTLFGVTINTGLPAMPSFRVGTVRLWDSGTRWSEIQAQRGEFNWSVLDGHVSAANDAGLPVLLALGGTPRWASPDGPRGPYPDGSTPAPPDSLADWDTFIRALVQRYDGRIESYELWVLANDQRFYSGSVETLVEMTRRASRIIRSVDPRATVVCPGMGQLWTPAGVQFLDRFAELGGYDYCDVAGVKLFQRTAADPPETMLDLVSTIDQAMHKAGIQPRLWNTGTTYDIPLQGSLDATTARDYAARFFLVGIYGRKENLERMYFYNWGGTRIPVVLQPVGGAPTPAAQAVEQLQVWLAHAQSRSCGHGMAIGLPANVWECEFTIAEPNRSYRAQIQWTDTGTATVTADPGVRTIRKLDGSLTAVRAGDSVTVTEEPIL
ncbi:MAG: helix-turn-helix domain-containing protein, partial [Mycobacterium sp.]|nr:helix-turn-helix domain-containing protein [Mycobacterium sp.]